MVGLEPRHFGLQRSVFSIISGQTRVLFYWGALVFVRVCVFPPLWRCLELSLISQACPDSERVHQGPWPACVPIAALVLCLCRARHALTLSSWFFNLTVGAYVWPAPAPAPVPPRASSSSGLGTTWSTSPPPGDGAQLVLPGADENRGSRRRCRD